METDYNYLAFDAQYYLHRNFCALKSRSCMPTAVNLTPEEGDTGELYVINKYDFTWQDLVKSFVQSIVKVVRDYYSCSKLFLLWDCPPYHKLSILPDFKGDRVHHCQAYLDEFDIEKDPLAYLQEKEEVRVERIKQEAKYYIIDNLADVGMVSIIKKGYEADDLAYIFSHLSAISHEKKKSGIVSVDTDWLYWISENVNWIKSSNFEEWTYQDAVDECERMTDKLGVDVFTLKQWMDSTFYSHNGLEKTSTLGWKDFEQLYSEVTNGDYTHITDRDRFEKNMRSFEIWNYPEYDEVVDMFRIAMSSGSIGKTANILKLRNKGINISDNYFQKFWDNLNPSYYDSTVIEEGFRR